MKDCLQKLVRDSKAYFLKENKPLLLPKPKPARAKQASSSTVFHPPHPQEKKKTEEIRQSPEILPPPSTEAKKPSLKSPPPKKTPRSSLAKTLPEIQTQTKTSQMRFSTNSMAQFLQKFLPSTFVPSPLDDALAKRIKNRWKKNSQLPQVVILRFSKEYQKLLENLATAIDLQITSARVIEASDWVNAQEIEDRLSSGQIQLIISSDHLFSQNTAIKSFYRELPVEKKRFLGNVPLLLLPDLSLYYSDPMLKRSLWNLICRLLSKTPASPKSS